MAGRFHFPRLVLRLRTEAEEDSGAHRAANGAARILRDEQVLQCVTIRRRRGNEDGSAEHMKARIDRNARPA